MFVKMIQSKEIEELIIHHPIAANLLFLIGSRVRISDSNINGLKRGECFIGGNDIGSSYKQYRNAKKVLEKAKIAAFKGTSKGTVVTLLDSSVYDLSEYTKGNQKGNRGADEGQTRGKQGATNKESKIEESKREDKKPRKKSNYDLALEHEYFKNTAFVESWGEFLQYKGANYSQLSKLKALNKLFPYSVSDCIISIDEAIASGWKGLHPKQAQMVGNNQNKGGYENLTQQRRRAAKEWAEEENIFEDHEEIKDAEIITSNLLEG